MKILTAREKSQNSVRESEFLYVKKLEKRPKIRFTHTFDFHGKKKNAALIITEKEFIDVPPLQGFKGETHQSLLKNCLLWY